jgi:hypothetical protein
MLALNVENHVMLNHLTTPIESYPAIQIEIPYPLM